MQTYKINPLQKYIIESKVIVINDYFKVRIANSLYEKYTKKNYDNGIKCFSNYINEIKNLNIKYPGNANPIFYIYIVPNDTFKELLGFDNDLDIFGGGRPVIAHELDSFPNAYGVSSNIIEKRNNQSIMQNVNSLHEIAHLIHSVFYQYKNRFISEGIADVIPLYILDYESKFPAYLECIKELTEDKILSAKELINCENSFDRDPLIKNGSCSFSITYISSYLFIRGCVETIENTLKINRIEALQKLLEILKISTCINEWGVFDIANAIGIPQETLLYDKDMQLKIIKKQI